MASTLASFDAFIKEYYNPQKVEDLTKTGKPFYGRCKANTEVTGDPWVVPILTSNPQGVTGGGTLANAQTATGNTVSIKWNISMSDVLGTVAIGDKVMMASRNNMGAFLQDKTVEIDGLYETFSTEIAVKMWRNGGGASGQVATIVGNVITFVNPADVFFWEVNQFMQANSDDGTNTGTTPRAGSTFVTNVDTINGNVTVNNVASITGLAVGDFLFRFGDVVANTGIVAFTGVQAYITASPSTAAPALWTVTSAQRNTQFQRLSGCKLPVALVNGKGIEERIQILGSYMQGRFRAMGIGGTYEVYVHPEDWQTLNMSLQNRGLRPLEDDTTQFGYQYIDIITGGKRMKCFGDPFVPKGSGFIMRMDNFVLGSYGELITPVNGDGLQMLRLATTNDYEYRLKSYVNMSNNAPGCSGFVPMPT